MAMRAGGLLAGGVLLVVSWIGWYASSASLSPPHARRAASAHAPDDAPIPGVAGASVRVAPKVPASVGPLIPIFAELRDGTSLSDFLADQRAPRTSAFATRRSPV